jgi:2,4-dichlorophenol 6-monooxygenase
MLTDGAHRARVAAAIADQAEHFDLLGLHLGYAYAEGALVADGTLPPAVDNPVRDFVPSSRPGARLPHGWVNYGGNRVSTLDLVALDRLTLLVGAEGAAWAEAARRIDRPLRVLHFGTDVEDPHGWWQGVAGLEPAGALLLRPDQHVALLSADGNGRQAAVLDAAFKAIGTAPTGARVSRT